MNESDKLLRSFTSTGADGPGNFSGMLGAGWDGAEGCEVTLWDQVCEGVRELQVYMVAMHLKERVTNLTNQDGRGVNKGSKLCKRCFLI